MPNHPAPTDFVEVHWFDIVSCSEWQEPGEYQELKKMITRGWVLDNTAERLVICASVELSEDGTSLERHGDSIAIPWGVVESVQSF